MKLTKGKWLVKTRSGLAVGDEEGRFAGETPSEGNYVVRGEFGTLEEARLLIESAPELLDEYKGLLLRVNYMANAMRKKGLSNWINDWLSDGILNGAAIDKAEGK